MFRSKRGDYVKILTWDGSGLCLFAKRLEKGLDRGAVFTGQYLSLCRISFNKSNGLASQLRTGKEPLLARCDNATQALRLDRDRETIQAKLTLNHRLSQCASGGFRRPDPVSIGSRSCRDQGVGSGGVSSLVAWRTVRNSYQSAFRMPTEAASPRPRNQVKYHMDVSSVQ